MKTRVLLGPMPRLMEEILVRATLQRDDCELIGHGTEWDGLEAATRQTNPNVVIVAEDERREALRRSLVATVPTARFVVLREDGRHGSLYWVEAFGALSADEILDLAAGQNRGT